MSRSRAATPAGKRRSTARDRRVGHRRSQGGAATRASRAPRRRSAPAKRAPRQAPRRRTPPRPRTRRRTQRRPPSAHRAGEPRGAGPRFLARPAAGRRRCVVARARRRLLLLASRLVAGRGRRRRGRRGHQRRARADRRRADQGRGRDDDPARATGGDRARGGGLPDGRVGDVDPNFPHGMRIEVTERPPRDAGRQPASARSRWPPTAPCSTGRRGAGGRGLPVLEVERRPGRGPARRRAARAGARSSAPPRSRCGR